MSYSLHEINDRIRADAAGFLAECDESFHRRVVSAADTIAKRAQASPIVLLSSPPTPSPWTTTSRP